VNLKIGLSNQNGSSNISSYEYFLSTDLEDTYVNSISNIVANTINKCDSFSSGNIPSTNPNNKYTLPINTFILTVSQTTAYGVYVRVNAASTSLTIDSSLTKCNAIRLG
jgi:hypothetical protein